VSPHEEFKGGFISTADKALQELRIAGSGGVRRVEEPADVAEGGDETA
jgi:hypothetical protein